MGRSLCLLTLVALCVWGVQSWDIAVSVGNEVILYDSGIKRNTIVLKPHNPAALAYDAVNSMILYVDKQKDNDTICGYYLYSSKNVCFIKRNGRNIDSLAYEPRTQIVFFTDTNERSINWISLKHEWSTEINGNLLIKLDEGIPTDLTVDGCTGHIYWINKKITKNDYLERASFDGSKRELSMFKYPLHSMGMNLPEREIYYFTGCETCYTKSLIRSDLNFVNEEDTIYSGYHGVAPEELTVTKDYIYWINSGGRYKTLWQLPRPTNRNVSIPEPIKISEFDALSTIGIAANYEINELQVCVSLASLMSNVTSTLGNNIDAGDLCDKFCPKANCSVDAGLPTCSRQAGYIDDYEISACDGYCSNNGNCYFNGKTGPFCQCQADRIGDRCEFSSCLNYCLQGNCSFNDERLPTCSCNAGYTGKRCEVSVCCGYCLNGGVCSLNEKEQPVCQCVGDHEGTRCEFKQNTMTVTNSSTYYTVQKNTSLVDLVSGRKPATKISVNVEVTVV
ncbi:hypothetical protein PYW07_014015 [Mythimna separata]|uniref:EGF-like domain-containing protein n=1 Tax=Mythimna separata TaxID=271217 RepID=A0AAD8DPW6_MYTSE|nr:hypothetical protein PYW07_014015 [Mythimna separata]